MVVNVRKLGEVLKEAGIIDDYQLQSALSYQRNWGGRLGSCLIKLGYLNEEKLADVLARQYQLKKVDLSTAKISEDALRALSASTAKKYQVMPVGLEKKGNARSLLVAVADPTNMHAIDDLQFITGCAIETVIATESTIDAAIDYYYEVPPAAIIEDLNELATPDVSAKPDVPAKDGDRFLRLVRILHAKKVLSDDDLESLLDS